MLHSWSNFYTESNKVTDRVTIKMVDGHKTRMDHHVDFIGGGHYWAYTFIPKDTIWLEKMKNKDEEQYILIHELIERMLMRYLSTKYDSAHKIANAHEDRVRHGESYKKVLKEFIDSYFHGDDKKYEDIIWSYENI